MRGSASVSASSLTNQRIVAPQDEGEFGELVVGDAEA